MSPFLIHELSSLLPLITVWVFKRIVIFSVYTYIYFTFSLYVYSIERVIPCFLHRINEDAYYHQHLRTNAMRIFSDVISNHQWLWGLLLCSCSLKMHGSAFGGFSFIDLTSGKLKATLSKLASALWSTTCLSATSVTRSTFAVQFKGWEKEERSQLFDWGCECEESFK